MRNHKLWMGRSWQAVSLICGVLILVAITAQAQTAAASGGDHNDAGVMKVMQQWLDALQTRDMKTLEQILGEEWTDDSRFGVVYTRKDFLADAPAKTPASSAAVPPLAHLSRGFENIRVRMYGDVAIVTGTVGDDAGAAESSANALPRTIFTDVLVWRDGRWQAGTSQKTAIPGTANSN